MKAYSIDLRERVLASIDDVMTVDEASVVFKVSKKTIYRWQALHAATGSVAPKTGYQKGHSHKIKDWDAFIIFAEDNKHHTIKEMVVKWEKLNGESISESTIQAALSKINYTSKKKILNTPKPMLNSVKYF